MPIQDCSDLMFFKTKAQFANSVQEGNILWQSQYQSPLSDLQNLNNNCLAKAYFIFSRFPYVEKIHNKTLLNDIRFLRNPRGDFSTLLVEENPSSCPKNIPPWVPPRESFYEK
jgi:hypothetical protein